MSPLSSLPQSNEETRAQVAILSDQVRRADARIEQLEIDVRDCDAELHRMMERLEGRFESLGDRVHKINNMVAQLEFQTKNNSSALEKWGGWGFAVLMLIGQVVIAYMGR